MSDENVRFKFHLDSKDAVKNANELHESITKIGDSKNLSGLIDGFTTAAGPIFVVGAALMAVKKAFDLSLEGESIERIHRTFEALSNQAGVSAQAIEEGMAKAVDGTVDMEDAMQSANKAIINLGSNADKIPQIMELARKAGKLYGVETLDAFEALNQAIVTGNLRGIKQLGLVVDAEAAQAKYAKSIGVTTKQLTDQEKQTATLNAILEKGTNNFKNIKDDSSSLIDNSKRLKVAFGEMGDAIALFINSKLGKFFADSAEGLTILIKKMTGDFQTPIQEVDDKLTKARNSLTLLKEAAAKREGAGFFEGLKAALDGNGSLTAINARLNEQKKIIADLEDQYMELDKKAPKAEIAKPAAEKVDRPKDDKKSTLISEEAFQRQLAQLKESRLNSEMEIETNYDTFQQQLDEKRLILAEQYETRIAEIRAKGRAGKDMTMAQADQMIAQIEEEKAAKLSDLEQKRESDSLRVFDNQLKAAKTTSAGMKAAFAQAGAQASRDLNNYGAQGQKAFTIVNTSAQKFFKGLGEGSKSAGELMKEFLLGALADYAEQEGAVILAKGIGTYDPVAISQGGALIALSAMIRGMAGGGGGSSGGASGGGGGGSSYAPSNPGLEKPSLDEEAQKKKSVTIQIQGNYFETEQSKTRLAEMIKETSDATDYRFQQLGGS